MLPVFKLKAGLSLVLASTSPRREELLASSGLPFIIRAPAILEPEPEKDETPAAYTAKMAAAKGRAASPLFPGKNVVIVAADTAVAIDDLVLGKPRDAAEAQKMLKTLNGRVHAVYTSVWLRPPNEEIVFTEKSSVRFGHWPQTALAAYVATGEPLDKAGAYAVQGVGSFLVEAIEGSWTNVKGLPLSRLLAFLLAGGIIVAT